MDAGFYHFPKAIKLVHQFGVIAGGAFQPERKVDPLDADGQIQGKVNPRNAWG
jgi:hypothetical protein